MLRMWSRSLMVLLAMLTVLAGCSEPLQPIAEQTAAPVATAIAEQPTVPVATTVATEVAPAATAPAAATTAAAPASDSVLGQMFAFVPQNTESVYFTDWSVIKRYKGVENLTSASPQDERQAFLLSTNQDQAAASAYAATQALQHAESWGWDSTDLLWEASLIVPNGSPSFVLRFRPDFDFAPVEQHFKDRDFATSTANGATVYSHAMDMNADWIRLSELAILNTALLADDHIMVLSSDAATVQTLLDAHSDPAKTWAGDAQFASVAGSLGEVAAVTLGQGASGCGGLSFGSLANLLGDRISPEQFEQLKERLQGNAQVHPYSVLAVGYRYEQQQPLGLIAMHYASADDATADVEARRALASDGLSLATSQPYSESVFAVDGAAVEGSDLVLRVRPVDDQPSRLFRMVMQRDMLFAMCP